MLFLINMIISLLCVWLFNGKWEKGDRFGVFLVSCFITPIFGFPFYLLLKHFWG